MKAQVLHQYGDLSATSDWLSYEDVEDPGLAKPTDVVVRIGGAGVCRADLQVIEGIWQPYMDPGRNALLPLVLGHENAGWIEEVGSQVEGLKKGDPVIVHPRVSGNASINSRCGQGKHCGDSFLGLNCNGGYAEALVATAQNVFVLPKGFNPKEVAPFAGAGLTAYRAAKHATCDLHPGEFCVVIGAGGLGHIAIQALRAMCAAEIIVVDANDASLSLAEQCGADHLIKADGAEVEAIFSITKGHGAEAVLDFVGEHGTTTKGLEMTRNSGKYFIVGYGEDLKIPALDLVATEKTIIGNLFGSWGDLTELMELAHRGYVQLETQEFKLENANSALFALHEGGIRGRAVLVP